MNPSNPRIDTDWPVEAWRALAAWMVVLAHFGPAAGLNGPLTQFAFTGVDLFFVLSGFVFAPYWLHRSEYNWLSYAIRRVFRIYPAYLVALSVMVLMAWAQGRPLSYIPEHLLFLHVQSREIAFYYNPAFWSLPAEVGFYLLLPWLASWSAAHAKRLVFLALLTFALRLGLTLSADSLHQNSAYIALHNLPGIAIEFAAGIAARALCERWDRPHGLKSIWRVCLIVLSSVIWYLLGLIFAYAREQAWGFSSENLINLLTVPCFALALAATGMGRSQDGIHPCPWWVVMALWLGGLSYGVYLTHVAWLYWAQHWESQWGTGTAFSTALFATIVSAWALHRWCEAPARQFGRRWAQRIDYGNSKFN